MRYVLGCCLLATFIGCGVLVADNREGVSASVAERAETCTPTPPVTIKADGTVTMFDGRLVDDGHVITLLDGPGEYIPDGEYRLLRVDRGYLIGAVMGPPNGCITILSTDMNGKRTVDCKKNGCPEPCNKVITIHADGTVDIYCGCNLSVPVTPSPAPPPPPTPSPNPGPGPSPN